MTVPPSWVCPLSTDCVNISIAGPQVTGRRRSGSFSSGHESLSSLLLSYLQVTASQHLDRTLRWRARLASTCIDFARLACILSGRQALSPRGFVAFHTYDLNLGSQLSLLLAYNENGVLRSTKSTAPSGGIISVMKSVLVPRSIASCVVNSRTVTWKTLPVSKRPSLSPRAATLAAVNSKLEFMLTV